MNESQFYNKLENKKVQCLLCPHNCVITEGKSGVCKVRVNNSGNLTSENYGLVSSIGFDPIEKKPLYHFYPGSEILSVGSFGCNLQCEFCQNWQISQTGARESFREDRLYSPEKIVESVQVQKDNIGIAYTYNEPTVFFEFMIDIARLAKDKGLKNVMVSNGFINQEPLNELNNYIDAYSIDLKGFNNDFFKNYTKSQLEPVKKSLINIAAAGKHLEITNLVIPTLNDDENEFEEMVKWISMNLGKEIVLHISKYYPTYKLKIKATSIEKMLKLRDIAEKYLSYVYLGNVLLPEGNNTYCPECNELLIKRNGYLTSLNSINDKGYCEKCGKHILIY